MKVSECDSSGCSIAAATEPRHQQSEPHKVTLPYPSPPLPPGNIPKVYDGPSNAENVDDLLLREIVRNVSNCGGGEGEDEGGWVMRARGEVW